MQPLPSKRTPFFLPWLVTNSFCPEKYKFFFQRPFSGIAPLGSPLSETSPPPWGFFFVSPRDSFVFCLNERAPPPPFSPPAPKWGDCKSNKRPGSFFFFHGAPTRPGPPPGRGEKSLFFWAKRMAPAPRQLFPEKRPPPPAPPLFERLSCPGPEQENPSSNCRGGTTGPPCLICSRPPPPPTFLSAHIRHTKPSRLLGVFF